MANNQITPFQLTDQFTMDNFNQRINETNTALQKKADLGADGKVPASQLPSMGYSKPETLSDTTKTLFGLDAAAVPDDVFAKLSAKETISNLVIERIYSSQDWVAPKVYNQLFKVFAVGGGGAGYAGSSSSPGGGGGSGFINIQNVTVPQGETVSIMCGAGGASSGADGGDTLFGDYLTANGGKGATTAGGDGEAGGGGTAYGAGGNGSVFGGGGGNGGNGGTYGGGGGGGGIGGTYGGNGGTSDNLSGTAGAAFAGTILSTLYPLRLSFPFDSSGGSGQSGHSSYGGGGGYGGPGGSAGGGRHGGGGGYGGKGGSPGGPSYGGGGGGGGYGGNGGNGASVSTGVGGGGGAGGFFCNGGNASSYNGGGGGGFFSDGSGITGGNGGVLIMYFKEETA